MTPLDVRTGLWQLTLNVRISSHASLPPETLANLTPDQRAKILAALDAAEKQGAAKETVQQRSVCVKPEEVQTGGLIFGPPECGQQVVSSRDRLSVRGRCGDTERITEFERIDAENLRGSNQLIGGGSAPFTSNQKFVAKWLSSSCADPLAKQKLEAAATASGASRDVLSFLPYLPKGATGRLGRSFSYSWETNNPKIPYFVYLGGIRDFPANVRGTRGETYFHGTDGQFLYVTIIDATGALCGGNYYKVDRSGNATRLPAIPDGLRGGKDELNGKTTCQAATPHQ